MSLLELKNIDVLYGESQVVWNLSMAIEQGQLTALVGANGAGKTTLLKTIVGLLKQQSGTILFKGQSLPSSAEQRVEAGIALVPEGRRLFAGLSIIENLKLGAYLRDDAKQVSRDLERVLTFFPELAAMKDRLSGDLSGGQQQMCAIGRALMSNPELLLVDEMSLGLAPVVVDRLAATLIEINRSDGLTIMVVEQDVELALEISTTAYVLETGHLVATGPSSELRERADIQTAFLGI